MTVVLDLRSSSSSSSSHNNNNNKSMNKILNTSTNKRDDDDAPAGAPITVQQDQLQKQRLIQKQRERDQDITSATLSTASPADAATRTSSSSGTMVHLHHQHSNNNENDAQKKSLLSSSTPPAEEATSSTQRHSSRAVVSAPIILPCDINDIVVASQYLLLVERTMEEVRKFYDAHGEIGPSHGLKHILKVHEHAVKAIASVSVPENLLQHWPRIDTEIQIAALLHDVDDSKYFPNHKNYENARSILHAVFNNNSMTTSNSNPPKEDDEEGEEETNTNTTTTTRTTTIINNIIEMISLVSCSKNGNYVPDWIVEQNAYYRLIPRWSDRLDTVGCAGVVRCYQYNIEHKRPLCGPQSPRATSEEEVWQYATPDRFEQYTKSGGASSLDMISHYYDKLLHVSRPPPNIVQNRYLETMQQNSSRELVEMCVRYGKTGQIDYEYINTMTHLENR